jgi:hypothetical protein
MALLCHGNDGEREKGLRMYSFTPFFYIDPINLMNDSLDMIANTRKWVEPEILRAKLQSNLSTISCLTAHEMTLNSKFPILQIHLL